MVRQHSTPWEERADSLKGIRSDYDSMRTKLSIALKRIELMSAGVSIESVIIRMYIQCKVHWRNCECGVGMLMYNRKNVYKSEFMLRRRG